MSDPCIEEQDSDDESETDNDHPAKAYCAQKQGQNSSQSGSQGGSTASDSSQKQGTPNSCNHSPV